ncbi:MAG TPA: site-specific DNA-methyltransferase, partial [Planctomycetes bacterium]|nr:site-specific DNA-methyltransferase [Planctomycetota bacterium]
MAKDRRTVAEKRNYVVLDVESAKSVCTAWLRQYHLQQAVSFGLPEVDDRYHVWRVPLISSAQRHPVGEIVIDARTSLIIESKSTSPDVLEARMLGRPIRQPYKSLPKDTNCYPVSSLRNTIALGDSEQILMDLPANSVD